VGNKKVCLSTGVLLYYVLDLQGFTYLVLTCLPMQSRL